MESKGDYHRGGEYGNISHNNGMMGDSKVSTGDLSMIRPNQEYYPSNTNTTMENEGLTIAGVKRRRIEGSQNSDTGGSSVIMNRASLLMLAWRDLANRPALSNELLKLELSWVRQPTNSSSVT